MNELSRLEALRSVTKSSVLIEYSTDPHEYICSIGHHHADQWIETHRTNSVMSVLDAIIQMEKEI